MTSSTKRRLFCDLETYSSVDITKAGAFKYVESDDFEIMLLAYAWDDEPVRMLDLLDPNGHDEMPDIMSGILDPGTVKVAHNSAFERACLRKYTGRYHRSDDCHLGRHRADFSREQYPPCDKRDGWSDNGYIQHVGRGFGSLLYGRRR